MELRMTTLVHVLRDRSNDDHVTGSIRLREFCLLLSIYGTGIGNNGWLVKVIRKNDFTPVKEDSNKLKVKM